MPVSNILVDEDGIGGGVVDNLKCQGFINNGKPLNPTYQNLKSECGYKLAELAGQIWIKYDLPEKEKEAIMLELGMLRTYDSDKDGKLRLMPKEKIKEYIGRSPDWLDCFIMRIVLGDNAGKKGYEYSGTVKDATNIRYSQLNDRPGLPNAQACRAVGRSI